MKRLKVAILGSTSHIAKGLIKNFLKMGCYSLYLYSRSETKVINFLHSIDKITDSNCVVVESYENFNSPSFDVIINCIGIGTLNKHQGDYASYFTVIEEYDNLVINYLLHSNPNAIYFNFSSGAVYGNNYSAPASGSTINSINVNAIKQSEYYAIARLNAEAKHRAFKDLNIVDIRLFSYFSRFADLTDGYFITEIIDCILREQVFITNDLDNIRDYVNPQDLLAFILKCLEIDKINSAFDVCSSKPVTKFEIIDYFSKTYNLDCKFDESFQYNGASGDKNVYYSIYNKAKEIGYESKFSSMDTIKQESKYILDKF